MRDKFKDRGTRLGYWYKPKIKKNQQNLENIFVKVDLHKEIFQEYFDSTHLGLAKKYVAKV